MCVIFFYVNSNPAQTGYKLILASNRDEFFARKACNAHKWSNFNAYGGVDMEEGREGGTWLAISGNGGIVRVGALLNLTGEPKLPNAVVLENSCETHAACHINDTQNIICADASLHFFSSNNIMNNDNNNHEQQCNMKYIYNHHGHDSLLLGRGMLTTEFVTTATQAGSNIEEFNQNLVKDCIKYNGFNFTSIEIGPPQYPARVCVCSNRPPRLQFFEEGVCHGFGNSLPDAPFEKVRFGNARFQHIVDEFHKRTTEQSTISDETQRTQLKDDLMSMLKFREKHWPDKELKRRAPNWGEYLSAINVHIPHGGYGSRTHTVILLDANDCLHFFENTLYGLDPDEDKWHDTYLQQPNFSQNSCK